MIESMFSEKTVGINQVYGVNQDSESIDAFFRETTEKALS